MNPSVCPFRRELHDRSGDVHASGPLLGLGVNLPAEFEHVGMDAKLGRDLVQFLVGLQMIPKLQPALRGLQVKVVGMLQRFHAGRTMDEP